MKQILLTLSGLVLLSFSGLSQDDTETLSEAALQFNFNGSIKSENHAFQGQDYTFVPGLDRQALSIQPGNGFSSLNLDQLRLDGSEDFTVSFWIKTTSENPTVLLSQKEFKNKGMNAQLNSGWALYTSGGTFAWNIGSGKRRLNYERDNGEKMPVNDGLWHQLTMTYNKGLREVRLYYDGHNKAIYKVGFDFANSQPLRIGTDKSEFDYETKLLSEIESGAVQLQTLVDEFNGLDVESLRDQELISLVVEPKTLYEEKLKNVDPNKTDLTKDLKKVNEIRAALLSNPYTIHQIREFTEIKPLNKIYSLKSGKVVIDRPMAQFFTRQEQLFPGDFTLDNLSIWETTLSATAVLEGYNQFRKAKPFKQKKKPGDLTLGVWNIWHGGIHFIPEEHGWDSRRRIVEILKEKDVDVILMQETYSSGDFIAAELGYYFATTSDWDYRQQGSNISVLSRYPIEELYVPEEAEFMNVAVKLAVSKTKKIYAMSNWYGMASFQTVFDFHKDRFEQSDTTPVFFGGDFNAVPHTDGGDSPASVKMLENAFTDAYRSLYPDVMKYPAFTHNSGVRIDQLYYKGTGLQNKSTEVISYWPGGFPSDHYLILSRFKLDNR